MPGEPTTPGVSNQEANAADLPVNMIEKEIHMKKIVHTAMALALLTLFVFPLAGCPKKDKMMGDTMKKEDSMMSKNDGMMKDDKMMSKDDGMMKKDDGMMKKN